MFDKQKTEPAAPLCPLCASPTTLKKVYRQPPVDHFIFKCGNCAIEYPVVVKESE